MARFAIRNPYFIVVVCLALAVIGINALSRMPVDLFPPINLPEVVVATFYNGMPPGDIEVDITNPLERFFTQASGIDHMESRSLLGVSVGDVGEAKDASQLRYNIVRLDGQKSTYIPIMKSGGDSNTIQVVNDIWR